MPTTASRAPVADDGAAPLAPAVGLEMVEELGGFELRHADRDGIGDDLGKPGRTVCALVPGGPDYASDYASDYVSDYAYASDYA